MTRHSSIFYNRFSFFYPIVDVFLRRQKAVLFREVNLLSPGNLLEVGVGNGRHLSHYHSHAITGIDTSSAMLSIAAKQHLPNTTLIRMNGEELEFPAAVFDYVVLSHVVAVAENPDKMLEEIFRVLKPGGKLFILNHFTPSSWLKYVDESFNRFSSLLHFKSAFYQQQLHGLNKFISEKEITIGRFAYFKLLILCKP